jgi:hypothetical protein
MDVGDGLASGSTVGSAVSIEVGDGVAAGVMVTVGSGVDAGVGSIVADGIGDAPVGPPVGAVDGRSVGAWLAGGGVPSIVSRGFGTHAATASESRSARVSAILVTARA